MNYKKVLSLTMSGVFALSLNFTGVLGSTAFAADNNGLLISPAPTSAITSISTSASSELTKAYMKNTKILSEEVNGSCTLSIDLGDIDLEKLGIPAEQAPMVQMALGMLKNIPMTTKSKMVTNEDKTKLQMQSDNSITLGMLPLNYKQWMDMDMTKGMPQEKIIMEIPDGLQSMLSMIPSSTGSVPEGFSDKKYLVYDTSKLLQGMNSEEMPQISGDMYKEIYGTAENFVYGFMSEILKCAENSSTGVLTKVSDKSYKMSFNNVSMKAFLEGMLNDTVLTDGLLNYMVDVSKITATNMGQPISEADLTEMKSQWTEMLATAKASLPEMEKSMDAVNFTLNESYTINDAGYIAKTLGDFSITLNNVTGATVDPEISALAGLNVSMNYTSEISNINGNVVLDTVPATTKDNSIDLADYIMNSMSANNGTIETVKAIDEISKNDSKFSKKATKDSKKPWKVKFSKELNPSTVNDVSVMVIDDAFQPVECDVKCSGENIFITPKDSYEVGKTYHIYLSTSIMDKTGKHLPKAVHQDFTVEK